MSRNLFTENKNIQNIAANNYNKRNKICNFIIYY